MSITLSNSKPILIGNIYQPPQGSIDEFIQVLDNVFNELDTSKMDIYIVGDINIDMSDNQNDAKTKFVNFIKPMGFSQLIKNTTRYSAT